MKESADKRCVESHFLTSNRRYSLMMVYFGLHASLRDASYINSVSMISHRGIASSQSQTHGL